MSILSDEIEDDPAGRGYQALLAAGAIGHVADLLNAQTELMRKETWITDIGLMSRLGVSVARSVLGKLKAMAGSDEVIAAVVRRLEGTGLNIGDPETIAMIDQLSEAPGGFSPEESTALKVLSLHPASTAEVLGLPYVTEQMVRDR